MGLSALLARTQHIRQFVILHRILDSSVHDHLVNRQSPRRHLRQRKRIVVEYIRNRRIERPSIPRKNACPCSSRIVGSFVGVRSIHLILPPFSALCACRMASPPV